MSAPASSRGSAPSLWQGLIFDLDGTLVDSLADIAASINLARREYGLAPLPEAEITARVGDGSDALVRQTIPVAPAGLPQALATYLAIYEQHLLDHTRLMPGMEALLARLASQPGMSHHLAVVTNKVQRLAERILAGLGVRDLFSLVLGGDALPHRKPHPLPIQHALEAWQVQPARVAMIGDGINDVRAGKAAGVRTLALTFGVGTREVLAAEGPDFLLDSVAELQRLLLPPP